MNNEEILFATALDNLKQQMIDRQWYFQHHLPRPKLESSSSSSKFELLYEQSFLVSKTNVTRRKLEYLCDIPDVLSTFSSLKKTYNALNKSVISGKKKKKKDQKTAEKNTDKDKEKDKDKQGTKGREIILPSYSMKFVLPKSDDDNEHPILPRPRLIFEEMKTDVCLEDEVLVLFIKCREIKALGKEPITKLLLLLRTLCCKHVMFIIHNPYNLNLLISNFVMHLLNLNSQMKIEFSTLQNASFLSVLTRSIYQPFTIEKLTEQEKEIFLQEVSHNQLQQLPVLTIDDPLTQYYYFQKGDIIKTTDYQHVQCWYQVNYSK
jgi:RNA polymerase Rpb5, C-terminal domain